MPAQQFIRVCVALQYTGDNGQEVSEYVNMPVVAEHETHIEFGDLDTGEVYLTLQTGGWYESTMAQPWLEADFAAGHVSRESALLTGKSDIVSISVPPLVMGEFVDRVVTWPRPFADAGYDLSYATDVNTLGRVTCAPVDGTKTAEGITIRVTAEASVPTLGVVQVLAAGT